MLVFSHFYRVLNSLLSSEPSPLLTLILQPPFLKLFDGKLFSSPEIKQMFSVFPEPSAHFLLIRFFDPFEEPKAALLTPHASTPRYFSASHSHITGFSSTPNLPAMFGLISAPLDFTALLQSQPVDVSSSSDLASYSLPTVLLAFESFVAPELDFLSPLSLASSGTASISASVATTASPPTSSSSASDASSAGGSVSMTSASASAPPSTSSSTSSSSTSSSLSFTFHLCLHEFLPGLRALLNSEFLWIFLNLLLQIFPCLTSFFTEPFIAFPIDIFSARVLLCPVICELFFTSYPVCPSQFLIDFFR